MTKSIREKRRSPEEIRRDIEATKAAMSDKVADLHTRVSARVAQLKHSLDIREYIKSSPWLAVSAAVAAGALAARSLAPQLAVRPFRADSNGISAEGRNSEFMGPKEWAKSAKHSNYESPEGSGPTAQLPPVGPVASPVGQLVRGVGEALAISVLAELAMRSFPPLVSNRVRSALHRVVG